RTSPTESYTLSLHDALPISETEIAKFDIYEGLKDGASLCSNILVEPIAYNFKGVGYYTVRRRTIERMNDFEAVKFLLNRFNGKEDRKSTRLNSSHVKISYAV